VNLPPASSTMTVSAAMSRMFTSDSITTSSARAPAGGSARNRRSRGCG
jgi:hypothetical protein